MDGDRSGPGSDPFGDAPDPRFYYPAAGHEQAAARLRAGVTRRRGVVLLTGAAGTGKTMLCRRLVQSDFRGLPLLGTCRPASPVGLIERICQALRLTGQGSSPTEHADRLREFVLRRTSPKRPVVLLVLDQAENLSPSELDELALLCDLGPKVARRLRIVIARRPEIAGTLADPRFETLSRHATETIELGHLGEEDVASYIRHRLAVAGHSGPPAFDDDALRLIGQRSEGNPRLINCLCLAALDQARAASRQTIARAHVEGLNMPTVERPNDGRTATRAMDAARQTAEAVEGRIEEACTRAEAVTRRLEVARRTALETAEQTLQQLREGASGAAGEHEGVVEASIAAAEDRGREIAEQVAGCRAGLDTLKGEIEEAGRQMGDIASAAEEAQHQARSAVGDARAAADRLSETVAGEQSAAGQIAQRIRDALLGATALADRLRNAIADGQTAVGEIEQQMESALGRAKDRLGHLNHATAAAEASASTVRAEVSTAEEASNRMVSLSRALNAVHQRGASQVAEAAAAVDRLLEAVTEGQAAAERVEQQTRSAVAEANEAADRLEPLTEMVGGAGAAAEALKLEVQAAEGEADRVASLTSALGEANRSAASGVADANAATDRLLSAVTEGQAATVHIDEKVRSAADHIDDKVRTAADHIDEKVRTAAGEAGERLEALTETISGAGAAAGVLKLEVQAAEGEAGRVASLASALGEVNRRAASGVADANAATDRLLSAVTEGQAATDHIDEKVRSVAGEAGEHLEALTETISGAGAAAGALKLEVQAAVGEADRVASLTSALGEANRSAASGVAEANAATDRLLSAVTEGQAATDHIDEHVRTAADQIDEKVRTAAGEVTERLEVLTEIVGGAGAATGALKLEVQAAVGEADRIASLTSALGEANRSAASGVAEANAATDRLLGAVTEGQAAADHIDERARTATDHIDEQVRTAADHIDEKLGTAAGEAAERLEALTELVSGAGAASGVLKLEVRAAEGEAGRVASLTSALGEAHRSAASGVAEANAATDRLLSAVTEGRVATDHIDEKVRSVAGEVTERLEALTEMVGGAGAAAGALRLEVHAAEGEADRVASLTSALGEANRSAASGVADANAATDRLLGAVTEGQAAVEQIEQRTQAKTADAEERIAQLSEATGAADAAVETARAEAGAVEQACERAVVVRRGLTEQGDHLTQTGEQTRQRIETLAEELETGEQVYAELKELTADLAAKAQASIDQDRAALNEHARAVGELIEQLEAARRSALDVSQETLRRLREETLRLANEHKELVETAITDAQGRGQEVGEEVEALIDGCRANLETLRREVQAAEGQARQMAAAAAAAREAQRAVVAEASTAVERVQEVVSEGQTVVKDSEQRVKAGAGEVTDLLDRLGTAITDGEAGAERIGQRVRSEVDQAQERAEVLTDAVREADTVVGAVKLETDSARQAAQQAASMTDALQQANRQASCTIAEATETDDRLRAATADAQSTAERVKETLEARVREADDRTANLADTVARADESADTVQDRIQTAEEVSERVAGLIDAAEQASRQADSANTGASAATERLRGVVADGQTAVEAIEHRMRVNVADGRETLNALSDALNEGETRVETLNTTIQVAEEMSSRATSFTVALHQANNEAATGVTEARGATDRLSATVSDARVAAHRVGREVETTLVEANEALETARHKVSEAVSDGEVAVQAVGQRVETAVTLADQEAEKLEAQRAGAAEVSARLEEQLTSAETTSRKMGKLVEQFEGVVATAGDRARQCAARTDQMDAARAKLDEAATEANSVLERLTAETPQFADLMCKLEERLGQLTKIDAELLRRIGTAQDTEARCKQQAIECGEAWRGLADLIRQAAEPSRRLEEASTGAEAIAQRVAEQRESARATMERQQISRDKGLALLEETQQRAAEAEELVARLTQSRCEATESCEELGQRADRAAQTLHRLGEHIEAADARREVLSASEQTLAEFVEQAEGINRQLQRIQAQADAFEVKVNQLIDRPVEIAAEARQQAAQLQGVCRAVRKVFAGLSEATLQAKQHTDEFRQTSTEAEARAGRINAETGRATGTLRAWVEEAVRVQARLADYLERCPTVERTHPTDSLRGLVTMTAPQGTTGRRASKRIESIEATGRQQALELGDTGAPRAAEARKRAEEVARLLQEAHKFAEATR